MKTVADVLRERNIRITAYGDGGEYRLWFNDQNSLWTITLNKKRARRMTMEFETEVEHQAVERFLELTK